MASQKADAKEADAHLYFYYGGSAAFLLSGYLRRCRRSSWLTTTPYSLIQSRPGWCALSWDAY